MLRFTITAALLCGAAFGQTTLDTVLQHVINIENGISSLKITGGTGGAPVFQPGLGGVRMTTITPVYTADLEALGSMVGPPLLMPSPTSCDPAQQLIKRNPNGNEPSMQFSCAHLNQTMVVQVAYKSITDGNCYLADWNGTFKFRTCYPGLPQFPTGTNGALLSMLDWRDTSINWDAGGGRCLYTPADLNSSAYGSLRWAQCGTIDGRQLTMAGDVFCRAYPKDATCSNGTTPATPLSGGAAIGSACGTPTDCAAGNFCYYLTPTSPGTCGPSK